MWIMFKNGNLEDWKVISVPLWLIQTRCSKKKSVSNYVFSALKDNALLKDNVLVILAKGNLIYNVKSMFTKLNNFNYVNLPQNVCVIY